tara:strand:- start:126 stop:575 length:450 start_codon:yes stop_codon:yes gene_type:complete
MPKSIIKLGLLKNGVEILRATFNRGLVVKKQAAPIAETGAATLTAADLLTNLITITHTVGSTAALTTDTGALIEAGLPMNFDVNDSFEFTIINLSAALADTATLTAGASGVTIVGKAVIDSAHADSEFPNSGTFRVRKSAADTFIIYRL